MSVRSEAVRPYGMVGLMSLLVCALVACSTTTPATVGPTTSAPGAPAPAASVPLAASSASPAAVPSAAAAPSASASPAPASAAGAPLTKVTSAYSTVTTSDLPLWYAKETGIFERHGLDVDVQLIQNPATIAALLAGDVDVTIGGGSDMLGPVSSGADLEMVANVLPTLPYVFEVSPRIQSPADLKGATIGASQAGGADYVALQSVLKRLGLDPANDVAIQFVGGIPSRTAALLSGAVEGTLTTPPETLPIEAAGFHPLIDLTTLGIPVPQGSVVVHRSLADEHRDTLQRFVDGLVEAVGAERQDKARAEAVMQKYLQLTDQQALDATYDFFVGKLIPPVPSVSPDQLQDSITQLSAQNPAIASIDPNKLVDASFVQAATQPGAP